VGWSGNRGQQKSVFVGMKMSPDAAVRFFVSFEGTEVLVVFSALFADERTAFDVGRFDVVLQLKKW
jgi:hypothetical protein